MGMTWNQLTELLDEVGIKKRRDNYPEKPSTTFMFGDEYHDITCRIILDEPNKENKDVYEFLHMRLTDLVPDAELRVAMKDPETARKVGEWMLGWNFQKKIGSWAVDTDNNDGDHYLGAVFPIENGTMTLNQFARTFGSLHHEAANAQDGLRKILGLRPLGPAAI